jgi:IMP-specific 5'-nucleotidase
MGTNITSRYIKSQLFQLWTRLNSAHASSVAHQKVGLQGQSKLKLLVPSIGTFFTRLPLVDAFRYQDRKRSISSRRFVPPSFNDIRLILNTAQLMGVTNAGQLDLATFDGDVTLWVIGFLNMAFEAKLESVMMTAKAWSPVILSSKESFVSIL